MPTPSESDHGRPKSKEERFGVTFRGRLLGGILWRTTKRGETIIKPLLPANAHLSLFAEDNKLRRHVTHEKYPRGSKRRHTQKGTIRPEDLALSMLGALAPADDPPPKIDSFQDKEQFNRLVMWFERVFPRIFRKAEDRPIVLLKGPLQGLVESGMFGAIPDRVMLDVEPLMAFYRDAGMKTEEDAYIRAKETDLRPSGPRIGFTDSMKTMVVCVGEGMVLELDYERLEEATMNNIKLLGLRGLVRALRRKGVSLFNEAVLAELRESEFPQDQS